MIIKKFYIPSNEAIGAGLQEIDMPRLGRFVALAGRNGAGKSRLLKLLQERMQHRNYMFGSLPGIQADIQKLKNTIQDNPGHPSITEWEKSMQPYLLQAEMITGRVISNNTFTLKSLRFVPKNLNLEDPRSSNQQTLINRFNQAKNAPIEEYSAQCLPYIQQLQNRWWSATHPAYSGDTTQKETVIDEYTKFNELVQSLLGVPLTRSSNDEASIFDKPLADSGLSEGQRVVLQLAAAIHAQGGILDNTVFILDELENHLHPSAAIELLEKLDQAAPNSQIWIATHSIPLLAYILSIEPMSLWYIEDGKISHAGRHPERVLKSLLGDEIRIGQLHAFTGLPAQLASTNYAVESLLPPATLSAQDQDPQINQISNILGRKFSGNVMSILDFGSGKGRLLEGLAANEGRKINERIDYFALDSSPTDRATCLEIISEYFDAPEGRHFSSPEEFFAIKDDSSIDVIVMCNVFHEIPPSQWLPLFSQTSLIFRALKDDGFLLIVEDQRIPVGEKAHEHGFLVLDTAQLKTLFGISEADINAERFVLDSQRDGRLKGHLIAKSLLAQISTANRTASIKQLLESALSQIRNLRHEEANYLNGQSHGFWTQQLANAYMYLNENAQ